MRSTRYQVTQVHPQKHYKKSKKNISSDKHDGVEPSAFQSKTLLAVLGIEPRLKRSIDLGEAHTTTSRATITEALLAGVLGFFEGGGAYHHTTFLCIVNFVMKRAIKGMDFVVCEGDDWRNDSREGMKATIYFRRRGVSSWLWLGDSMTQRNFKFVLGFDFERLLGSNWVKGTGRGQGDWLSKG